MLCIVRKNALGTVLFLYCSQDALQSNIYIFSLYIFIQINYIPQRR